METGDASVEKRIFRGLGQNLQISDQIVVAAGDQSRHECRDPVFPYGLSGALDSVEGEVFVGKINAAISVDLVVDEAGGDVEIFAAGIIGMSIRDIYDYAVFNFDPHGLSGFIMETMDGQYLSPVFLREFQFIHPRK